MASVHVIYVPGLGDFRPRGQKLVTRLWRVFGVHGHYVPMHWGDGGPFAEKLDRLTGEIDALVSQGHTVSLIGSSAGASAILLAFAVRRDTVASVACVCGKINRPETLSAQTLKENPAFEQSMTKLQEVLPTLTADYRAKIFSLSSTGDHVVPPADTRIAGSEQREIMVMGHAASIAATLTLFAPALLGALKRLAAKSSNP